MNALGSRTVQGKRLFRFAAVSAIGMAVIQWAGVLDSVWHGHYRDLINDFWSLPHDIIYGGLLTLLVVILWLGLPICYKAYQEGMDVLTVIRTYPLIAFQIAVTGFYLLTGPIDMAVHAALGRDLFTIYTLPHAMIGAFTMLATISIVGLAWQAKREGASEKGVEWVIGIALATLISTTNGWLYEWSAGYSFYQAVITNDWLAGPVTSFFVTFTSAFVMAHYQKRPWMFLVLAGVALVFSGGFARGVDALGFTNPFHIPWITYLGAAIFTGYTLAVGKRFVWGRVLLYALFGVTIPFAILFLQRFGLYPSMTWRDIFYPIVVMLTLACAIAAGLGGDRLVQWFGAPAE